MLVAAASPRAGRPAGVLPRSTEDGSGAVDPRKPAIGVYFRGGCIPTDAGTSLSRGFKSDQAQERSARPSLKLNSRRYESPTEFCSRSETPVPSNQRRLEAAFDCGSISCVDGLLRQTGERTRSEGRVGCRVEFIDLLGDFRMPIFEQCHEVRRVHGNQASH